MAASPTAPIPRRTQAVPYEHALRFWVPSRTVRGKRYLVQLDYYHANGFCTCPDFACNLEPLLKQGITPADAVARGLVKLKNKKGETKHVWDALRCHHLIEARAEWSDLSITAFSDAEKKHPPSPQRI